MASRMRIALFGGSFNPVHIGHVAVCRDLVARRVVDRVVVVPCLQHPFDKALVPFAHRFAMCRMALQDLSQVDVSDIEQTLGGVSYTARTLRALQARTQSADWFLVVGADAMADLGKWQEADWIRAHATLVEIPRGPQSPIPDVSATQIRATLAAGGAIAAWVPPVVEAYIRAQGLYLAH